MVAIQPNYFTCTLGQAAALDIQQPEKRVNDLIDALAKDVPDGPAVGFLRPNAPEEPWSHTVFTFNSVKQVSEKVARAMLSLSAWNEVFKSDDAMASRPSLAIHRTVALMAPSGPAFLFTWLALLRLRHPVLLIAPQCPPQAIAQLCIACDVPMLIYDHCYTSLASEASALVKLHRSDGAALVYHPISMFSNNTDYSDIVTSNHRPLNPNLLLGKLQVDATDVAYLHHTSGTSSGTPKPIPQTHSSAVGVLPTFSNNSHAATFTTTPLYHGGIADLFRAWSSHAMIWLFPERALPITATNVIRCLDEARMAQLKMPTPHVKYFSSVPYVLQMLAEDPRGIEHLHGMDIVGVGGAPLPDEVGDRLVNYGVNLISRFGSAECGFLLSSHRNYATDKAWQYLRADVGAEYLRFEPAGDGLSELVVSAGWPHVAKRNREDGSYATSDLFALHPTIPNAWRYHSRADAQLTLVTGKKFDPAPLETSIATLDIIEDAVIFGSGRPFPGVLIFRSKESESLSDEEMMQALRPFLDSLNSRSQDHAKLSMSMVVPMPCLSTPLEKSSKGTLMRGVAGKRFADTIDAAYDRLETVDGPTVLDHQVPEVVRDIVRTTVPIEGVLAIDTDLFSYGVDSMMSMQIRYKLRRLLPPNAPRLPISVIEDCGCIGRIADYILRIRRGEEGQNKLDGVDELRYMETLVDEYGKFEQLSVIQQATSGLPVTSGAEVIVLTGVTGALGAQVLRRWAEQANVSRIYCLVRGANHEAARERVARALAQPQFDPLSENDNRKIVVLQARLSEAHLGLDDAAYATLTRDTTTIVHIAWAVNFRMRLRSFVKDHIAGLRNLINLALASQQNRPPRFAFCSSVASAIALEGAIPEELVPNPAAASPLGYSRSKWVGEQICGRAAQLTRLRRRMCVFRVGQLAGESKLGVWNPKEAWPLMLSSMTITHCLPALENEMLNWLPIDVAAYGMIQGMTGLAATSNQESALDEDPLQVYHVLNEHTTPSWMEMLRWLQKEEDFEIVPPSAWLAKLEHLAAEGVKHSSLQLLDLWKTAYGDDYGTTGERMRNNFVTLRTKSAIPSLAADRISIDERLFMKLWKWIKEHVS